MATDQELDGTAFCGSEDAESVTNEDEDPPEDYFDLPTVGESDDDEDTSPIGPAGEAEV